MNLFLHLSCKDALSLTDSYLEHHSTNASAKECCCLLPFESECATRVKSCSHLKKIICNTGTIAGFVGGLQHTLSLPEDGRLWFLTHFVVSETAAAR
mmetsp:Transcript_31443/g.78360  ORF Transcript_31443/g.78360 Transcript_31443/m.78360 type:complete len:97 (-) Transcript_31443:2211-2501(-)